MKTLAVFLVLMLVAVCAQASLQRKCKGGWGMEESESKMEEMSFV